jgi:hypothetical protein
VLLPLFIMACAAVHGWLITPVQVLAHNPGQTVQHYVLPMPKWPVRESALLKRLAVRHCYSLLSCPTGMLGQLCSFCSFTSMAMNADEILSLQCC